MKRIIALAFALMMAFLPMSAQSKKAVKQAKTDTKYELAYLKDAGYKTMDNTKVDDQVKAYLTSKYDDKSCVEVIGKATEQVDLNEAKAKARQEAVAAYPVEDVKDVMFFYRKNKKKYDVICYALVSGSSATVASGNAAQYLRKGDGTAASIQSMKEKEAVKEGKAEAKKEASKAKAKAKKEASKAKKEAQKKAEKEAKKTYDKEMEKSGFKR